MTVNLLSELSESLAEISGEYEEVLDKIQNGGELDRRDHLVGHALQTVTGMLNGW